MSYGTSGIIGYSSEPPSYEDIFPEGETINAGFDGSTISKSGLGPNVSVNPSTMADVKPTATQPSPKASSKKMAQASSDIPSTFDNGKSAASDIADEIGTINSGQSKPVSA
jgi:hypothetical protein